MMESPALFNIALESVKRETLITASGVKIGINKQLILAAYEDDLVIMAENEISLKDTTQHFLENGKIIGLTITSVRQNTWFVTRNNHRGRHLNIRD